MTREPTQTPAQVISEAVREWRLEDTMTVKEAVLAALDEAGWVVVRREPTDAMMEAGLYQASHDAEYGDVYQSYVDMVKIGEQGVNNAAA